MFQSENAIGLVVISAITIIFIVIIILIVTMIQYHNKLLRKQRETFDQILRATEIESQRIGQNLHDDLGPMLASIKLSLSGALMAGDMDHGAKQILENGKEYISEALLMVRDQAHVLSAANIQQKGLHEILLERINLLKTGGGWNGSLENYSSIWEFDQSAKLMLFRVLNELIYNTVKHSDGDSFKIEFQDKESQIWIRYTDNGGKELDTSKSMGIGLKGIQSRVKFLKGTMEFYQQVGFGLLMKFPKSHLLESKP